MKAKPIIGCVVFCEMDYLSGPMALYRGSKWSGHVVPAGGVLLGDTRVQTVFANRKQARDAIVRTMDWWHGMQRHLDWPADAYSILNLVGYRAAEKAT